MLARAYHKSSRNDQALKHALKFYDIISEFM